jgi:hypothetical protein
VTAAVRGPLVALRATALVAGLWLAGPAGALGQAGDGSDLAVPPPPAGAARVDAAGRPAADDDDDLAAPDSDEVDALPLPPPPPPGADADAPGTYEDFGTFPAEDALDDPRAPARRRGLGRAALLDLETGGLDIPNHVATRLRILDGDLTALAARGGGAIVDGVLSMVAGGVSITLAIVLDDEDPLGPFLYLVGSAAVARGILNITLVPNAEEPAVRFAEMPMSNRREVLERLAFGEAALARLAERNRLARLLDAGLNLAVGVAIVPLWLGPNDFTLDEPVDYFIVIAAGISILSGVITLLSETDAERRWRTYAELKERLASERRRRGPGDPAWDDLDAAPATETQGRGPGRPAVAEVPVSPAALGDGGREAAPSPLRPRLGGGPIPGGAAVGLAWRF